MGDARRMGKARENWVAIVGQFERSGLTQEAFAEQRHIAVGTLRSWIYRLRRESDAVEGDAAAPILPVRVVASTAPWARRPDGDTAPAIEVAVGETVRVRFPLGTAPSVIAEVVALLHERC